MIRFSLTLLISISLLTACNSGGGGGESGGGSGAANTNSGNNNSGGGSNSGTTNTNLLSLDDPLTEYAWFIKNTGQSTFATNPGTSGEDLGLDQVYKDGIYGDGVTVVISDGRIDLDHEDLSDNTNTSLSKNYQLSSPYIGNPTSNDNTDNHGTSVMGIVGAVADNDIGSHGIAPKATLIGYNYLAGTYGNVAQRIDQANLDADIYNYSYGSDTCFFETENSTYIAQLKHGTETFRSGKGAIYITSAGNDGSYLYNDSNRWCPTSPYSTYIGNSNLQQFKSYPYVITVASTNAAGIASSYSTPGSNVWISGAGGEFGQNYPAIITADLEGCDKGIAKTGATTNQFESNQNNLNTNCNYTSAMNGTSSAAPTVAGSIALILEANPNLTWRDVKLIIAATAYLVDPYTGYLTHPMGSGNDLAGHEYQKLWQQNGAGYWFNNKYGFGRINVDAAVALAKTYTANLGDLKTTFNENDNDWYYKSGTINEAIPDNDATGASSSINVKHAYEIEAVQVKLNISHTHAGDLGIELTSPSGMKSQLMLINSYINETNLTDVTFLANSFMQEKANGTWTLKVIDGAAGDTGTLVDWELRIWGHNEINPTDTVAPANVTALTMDQYKSSLTTTPDISFSGSAAGDVLRYEGCFGTAAGLCDIKGWEYISVAPPFSMSGLTLVDGTEYFFNIRTIDTSENISSVSTVSWTVDTTVTPPSSIIIPSSYYRVKSTPSISFSPSSVPSDIEKYEYSIGTSSGGTNIKAWTSIGTNTTFTATGLTLTRGNTYHVNVRAVDYAGNISSVTSASWAIDALWSTQLGNISSPGGTDPSGSDICNDTAIDSSGNIFCVGQTEGSLDETNAGSNDIFITKFNSKGEVQWITQLGSSSVPNGGSASGDDKPESIDIDSSGNIYIAGSTTGNLGETKRGQDPFIAKFDSSGTPLWITQVGNTTSPVQGSHEASCMSVKVSSDDSKIYCGGYTSGKLAETSGGSRDAFVMSVNSSGVLQWITQLGANTTATGGSNSGEDFCYGVDVDSTGNIYCAGHTDGSLAETNAGGDDLFVIKLNSSGALVSAKQMGTTTKNSTFSNAGDERLYGGMRIFSDNLYLAGRTDGSFATTIADARPDPIIVKFDTSLNLLGSHQETTIQSLNSSCCYDIDINSEGVYCAGAVHNDGFVLKVNHSLVKQWDHQVLSRSTTPTHNHCNAVSVDLDGSAYCSGYTNESLFETGGGDKDAYIHKIDIDGVN